MKTNILTAYRFFAAIIVVIFHYASGSVLDVFTRTPSGPMMVSFFFVLSGFVLTFTYLKKEEFSVTNYIISRVARIVPVYIFALILTTFLVYSNEEKNLIIKTLSLDIFFLQSWITPYALYINNPAWSLSVEAFFYMCFPLIIIFLSKKNTKPYKLLLFSLIIYITTQIFLIYFYNSSHYNDSSSPCRDLVLYFPLSHLSSFIIGISGGYFSIKTDLHNYFNKKSFWTIGTLIGMVVIANYTISQNSFNSFGDLKLPIESSFLSPLFLFFIIFSVNTNNILIPIFSLKPLIILGEASYSIYILQRPIALIFMNYFLEMLPDNKNIIFFIYLTTLIVFSIIIYYFFEIPTKNIITRKLNYMKK